MFDKQSYTLFKFGRKLKQTVQNKRELLADTLPALRELFRFYGKMPVTRFYRYTQSFFKFVG